LHTRVGALLGDVDLVEGDRTLCRRIKADDQLEERALPCSVWSDQAVNLADIHGEIDVGHSRQSTEALRDSLHNAQCHGQVSSDGRRLGSAGPAPAPRRRRPVHRSATSLPTPSTKPCGANITVASKSAPINTSAACWL